MKNREIIEKIVSRAIERAETRLGKFAKPPKGWIPWVLPTGLFIHDFLMLKGVAYPYEIYRALREARRLLHKLSFGKFSEFTGSPINFYKYIWCLERLGLIERTGRIEPSFRLVGEKEQKRKGSRLPSRFWRRYYRIKPGKEPITPEWLNPQKYVALKRGWRVKVA